MPPVIGLFNILLQNFAIIGGAAILLVKSENDNDN